MRKRRLGLIFGFMALLIQLGSAQQRIVSESELNVLLKTPMESVYLHLNRSTFFPGETLYYSVYTMNMQTYKLSAISKVVYVQLLDALGEVKETHRVRLKQGRGQGDFFFKTNYASGAYKIIAFTNWMKNAGINQCFQANLTVVNPYEASAGNLVQSQGVNNPNPNLKDVSAAEQMESSIGLLLETSCKTCTTEAEIKLNLKNFKGALAEGDYSLSVARVEEIPELPLLSAKTFGESYVGKSRNFSGKMFDTLWIPENREAIITGRLLNSKDSSAIANTPVVISLPGANFQLLTANTNSQGQFTVYMKAPYEGTQGFLDISSVMYESPHLQFENLANWHGELDRFSSIRIHEDMTDAIRQRSIHNQIENGYFEAKPDTVIAPYSEEAYFGNYPRIYDLEDYTRFSTFRETLVEIIQDVWVKTGPDKKETLWVRAPLEEGRETYTEHPPIVTVDGVWIGNHTSILDFDARQLSYVRVVQEAINWGGRQFQGMVALETIDRNYSQSGIPFNFIPAEPIKRYFLQSLTGQKAHVPDFRHQLYWNPRLVFSDSEQSIAIKTSQVPGLYYAQLEGFTSYGKPVSLRCYFEVVN